MALTLDDIEEARKVLSQKPAPAAVKPRGFDPRSLITSGPAKAAVKKGLLARAGSFVLGGVGGAIAGDLALAGVEKSNTLPAGPGGATRLERTGAIFSGAADRLAQGRDFILERFGASPTSSLARDPAKFGVPDPVATPPAAVATDQTTPPTQAAQAPGSTLPPTTPGVFRITNPDGSTSFSNVRSDIAAAVNRGAGTQRSQFADPLVSEVTPATSRGTVSTVPGVSAADKSRALGLFLRDKQFSHARSVAQTQDDLDLIDIREQQVGARGKKLEFLRNKEAALLTGRLTNEGKAIAARADAAGKAGTQRLANTKADQIERSKIIAQKFAGILEKKGPLSAQDLANVAAIQSGKQIKLNDKVFFSPSLIPGEPPMVIRLRDGASKAEILEAVQSVPLGTPIYDKDGNKVGVAAVGGKIKAE